MISLYYCVRPKLNALRSNNTRIYYYDGERARYTLYYTGNIRTTPRLYDLADDDDDDDNDDACP